MSLAIIPVIKTIGDVGQLALPIGAGLHAHYKGYKTEGALLAFAAGIQQVVLYILKTITQIPRPYPNHLHLDSFPSGHTAGAFLAVGFILALDLINSRKSDTSYLSIAWKVSIVFLAFVVGVSRFLCRMHWPIDIVMGSLLGLSFGSAAGFLPHLINKSESSHKLVSRRC